ncbi:MAG TPA: neutral zinc metallopeptidase [Porphyromonadaceae bacterium]|nr:neutral zinc metallopeptidase [Porphyromonadaceae bacterium]
MNLEGRRESSNVEDRRGMSSGTKMGVGGIGGLIIAGIITLLMGGNLGDVLQQAGNMNLGEQVQTQGEQNFTAEEQELAKFASVIEASTEDVWTQIFRENNLGQYQPPTLVLYTGSTQTACGQGSAAVGPFYCSGDQKLYLDLSFFSTMKKQLGADGDFAYAYVIAHEVGHHIEYLTGTLQKAHQQMNRLGEADANKISVRLELLADFYAGVWAHYENKSFGSLDDSDLMEAIKCAQVIGDDYLQKRAQGYAMPESFTHGTSEQRMKWFKLGFDTGDIRRGTTFQQSDATL